MSAVRRHGGTAARGAAGFLSLAAAPVLAGMAVLTALSGDGVPAALCSFAQGAPLGGMVPMYALMSLFHTAPWLRLLARPGAAARRAGGSWLQRILASG